MNVRRPDDYSGWPRGWHLKLGGVSLSTVCTRCTASLAKCETPVFSPGEHSGLYCAECGLKECTEEQEQEYLEWLEDQAEIAEASK